MGKITKAHIETSELLEADATETELRSPRGSSGDESNETAAPADEGVHTVLLVAACPFPGNNGTSSRILRMGESLIEDGCDVHVATYHLEDEGIPISEDLSVHRVDPPFEYRKMDPGPSCKKPLLDALLAKKVLEISREKPIDVIHAHHIEGLACSLFTRAVCRIPVIYDAHTHVTSELEEYYGINRFAPLKIAVELIEKALVKRATGVISVSNRLKSVLTSYGLKTDSVWVVPTGINAQMVQRLAASSTLTRSDLGLTDDQTVIMYTGTLKPFQGLENLFEAMERVSDRHPDAKLLLVGGGDTERYAEISKQFDVNDSVTFCGDVPFAKVPGYLDLADIGVLPRTEATGMPQKLTNYMAVGVPVVAFRGSGKALSHRENGFVVDDGDVESFADGITALVDDAELRERLAARSRQSVSDYEWSSLVHTIQQAYSKTLGTDTSSLDESGASEDSTTPPRVRPSDESY